MLSQICLVRPIYFQTLAKCSGYVKCQTVTFDRLHFAWNVF